jgi:hypothetical protein
MSTCSSVPTEGYNDECCGSVPDVNYRGPNIWRAMNLSPPAITLERVPNDLRGGLNRAQSSVALYCLDRWHWSLTVSS